MRGAGARRAEQVCSSCRCSAAARCVRGQGLCTRAARTGAEHLDTKLNASRGFCLIHLAVVPQPPRFGKGNALPQHQAHHQHCSPALCRQRSVALH